MNNHKTALRAGTPTGSHGLAYAGLFLFTLLLYARPNEMFPAVFGTFPLVKIVAIVTLLAYAVSKLSLGERLTIWPLEMKMLAVITLLGILFIPLAAAPQDSINLLMDSFLKVAVIFVLMINLINTRERLRSIIRLAVICGTGLALFAISDYLSGELLHTGGTARVHGVVGGIFGNPNDLATSLDLLIPFAVSLAVTSRGLKRAAYFGSAAVLAVGVVTTFSRGGFLGLLAIGGILLWKMGRKNRAITALAFAAILGAFILVMPGGYSTRMLTIFNIDSDPTGSAQLRREQLNRALSVASRHVIIGVGMGNYHIYSLKEQKAHNSFLEIAAELGAAGFIAYLIMIFAPMRSLRRIERESADSLASIAPDKGDRNTRREMYYLSAALQAAFIGYLICSFFGSIQYHWFLYYPLAYAISLRRIRASQQALAAESDEPGEIDRERTKGVLWRPRQRRHQEPSVVTETITNQMSPARFD